MWLGSAEGEIPRKALEVSHWRIGEVVGKFREEGGYERHGTAVAASGAGISSEHPRADPAPHHHLLPWMVTEWRSKAERPVGGVPAPAGGEEGDKRRTKKID